MAFEAEFRHGGPLMVDHTPAGAVAAGTVVIVGNAVRIAHNDLAANRVGALAAGGGVYAMIADGALVDGVDVYWDDTAKKVTATSTSNKVIGMTASAAAADGDTILVIHKTVDTA